MRTGSNRLWSSAKDGFSFQQPRVNRSAAQSGCREHSCSTQGGTMKLLRYGDPGHERPGLVDADGRIRDLSSAVPDVAGATLLPENLAKLRDIDPFGLP